MVAKEGDPLLLGQFYALSGKVINDRFKYTKRRFSQLEPEENDGLDPSKTEWDLTNGPLRKWLELWDTQV